MFFPEIIGFLLTLRYPGAETGKQNWVCYEGGVQIFIPLVPPGATVSYTVRPLHGVYAWLAFSAKFGPEIVPESFVGTIVQYGNIPYSGILSQRFRDDAFENLVLVTEQEPTRLSVTNISPLSQAGECIITYIVIPSPQDLITVTDALRRLYTSTESEQLLRQVVYLLGILAGQPAEPQPPLGGS